MKRLLAGIGITALVVFAVLQWVLPARIEAGQNIVLPHDPYVVSDSAIALHNSLFIADLHSDSLLWKRNLLARSSIGQMDLPRLREGNVALQVFSATTKSPAGLNYDRNDGGSDDITKLAVVSLWPPASWSSLYERAVYQLVKLHGFAAHSELTVVTSKKDMSDLIARRERGEPAIAALYLIEGAHPLEGDLENLDRLFSQGLRIVGLTHFFDNELGGSLHGISGDGLSDFGRSVVQRANELGAIIDVAHASPRMVAEVLQLSSTPVILSHGGIKGNCESARNLDDALMQEIARKGGLIGIGYWDAAVCDVTPAGIARAIRSAIELMGVAHVALGSDYDGTVTVSFDTSELVVLTDAMLQAGFTEEEIRRVMGENVKQFLLDNLP
jgi:microsomal dipeptidase-like Zn-dependent dipeptidase